MGNQWLEEYFKVTIKNFREGTCIRLLLLAPANHVRVLHHWDSDSEDSINISYYDLKIQQIELEILGDYKCKSQKFEGGNRITWLIDGNNH